MLISYLYESHDFYLKKNYPLTHSQIQTSTVDILVGGEVREHKVRIKAIKFLHKLECSLSVIFKLLVNAQIHKSPQNVSFHNLI